MAIRLVNKIVNIEKHGFVKIVDCMPRVIPKECKALKCDYAIVQAARVSFNQGIKGTEKDIKLIDFLMKNKHTSPFEMVKFKYIDQNHDDFNIGVISQQIEIIMPELVDVWDDKNIPEDGKPLMGVYMEDIHNISMKVLQEAMAKIEKLETEIDKLKNL